MSARVDAEAVELSRKAAEMLGTMAARTEGMSFTDAAVLMTGAIGAWLHLWTSNLTAGDRELFIDSFVGMTRENAARFAEVEREDGPPN